MTTRLTPLVGVSFINIFFSYFLTSKIIPNSNNILFKIFLCKRKTVCMNHYLSTFAQILVELYKNVLQQLMKQLTYTNYMSTCPCKDVIIYIFPPEQGMLVNNKGLFNLFNFLCFKSTLCGNYQLTVANLFLLAFRTVTCYLQLFNCNKIYN